MCPHVSLHVCYKCYISNDFFYILNPAVNYTQQSANVFDPVAGHSDGVGRAAGIFSSLIFDKELKHLPNIVAFKNASLNFGKVK